LFRAEAVTGWCNRWLALFLCVSGALALVYEVIWQRQFALVFGSAAPATAAVLAAYFAGLGLGAWWVGLRASGWTRPLRAYALLEALIGLGALLVLPFLEVFEAIYPSLYYLVEGRAGVLLAVRGVAALFVVLLPTFCMGGTLPLLGAFVDRGQKHLGLTAGWLYFVNTAGAALGALAVPFFLLPNFGMLHTVWGSAAINFALAAGAWFLDTGAPAAVGRAPRLCVQPARPAKSSRREKAAPPKARSVGWLAFVSGFTTFALQIFWNRAFAQLHENSMYSFAVVVAVTITALALGTQFARVFLRRGVSALRLLGNAWIAGGVMVAISPWVFIRASDGFAYLSGGAGWYAEAARLVLLAVGLLLVPMALVGVGFPALMEAVGQHDSTKAGRELGRIFSINVVGSIVGSLVSAFCLPRWLGLWNSLIALGVAVVAVGSIVKWSLRGARMYSSLPYVGGALTMVAVGLVARIDLPRVSVETSAGEKLVSVSEGPHGVTAVVERPGSRRLKLNNHYGLGGTASTGDERMQAHIPLLLHAAPRRVAFLGLGTGISAGGALFHPVEQVTIAELVPEVITVSRQFFAKENEHVLDDPRTRIVADDARHFLRGTAERFDVIVGDLVVPWRAGEGSLFTVEQFALAKRALAPGGIFCQWLPLFQLSEPEMKILLRTFLSVFPRAEIWRGDFSPTQPAIALIGSAGEWRSDPQIVRPRLREMRPDAANPQLRAVGNFWMQWVGVIEASDLPADEVRINTEDRPWVELLGPKLHGAGQSTDALFIGRRLQAWLDDVQRRSASRMAEWPEPERASAAAGRVLAEFVLRLSEHDEAGAEAAQAELRRRLPDAEYRALFP